MKNATASWDLTLACLGEFSDDGFNPDHHIPTTDDELSMDPTFGEFLDARSAEAMNFQDAHAC